MQRGLKGQLCNARYTWNKLRQFNWTEHSVHLAEVFDTCPGHFFRLGDDIGPQFVSSSSVCWLPQKFDKEAACTR